jgi:hypothetical protein
MDLSGQQYTADWLFHDRSLAVHGRLLTTAPPTSVVASRQLEELQGLYRLVAVQQRWATRVGFA